MGSRTTSPARTAMAGSSFSPSPFSPFPFVPWPLASPPQPVMPTEMEMAKSAVALRTNRDLGLTWIISVHSFISRIGPNPFGCPVDTT